MGVSFGNAIVASATEIVASGYCGYNLTWSLDNAGTLTISGTGEMYDWNYAPWYSYNESITSVVINSGVTSIEKCAFSGCTNLESITIPSSVESIEESAFYGCTSLESVYFGANPQLQLIGVSAFDGCTSLESITIPDSVESIGEHAFYGCTSLRSITIPDRVTSIIAYAFAGCTSLTSIDIPSSVTEIQNAAFAGCTSLESIFLGEDIAICYGAIPDTTTWVEYAVSDGKVTIKYVALGEGQTSVDIPATINGMPVVTDSENPDTPSDPSTPSTPPQSRPTAPIAPTTSAVSSEKITVKTETSDSTLTLKWDEIENADSYIVYQYKDGKYVKIKTTTDTSVTFKNVKNGKTYKFLVRYTINGKLSSTACSSKFTVKVYYKPAVKATSTENSVRLSWEEVPGAEKYAIYKYVDGKAVKLTETEKLAVKTNKLSPDTEYQYIVRAYVDGEWTKMKKSDIVTIKTKAE